MLYDAPKVRQFVCVCLHYCADSLFIAPINAGLALNEVTHMAIWSRFVQSVKKAFHRGK